MRFLGSKDRILQERMLSRNGLSFILKVAATDTNASLDILIVIFNGVRYEGRARTVCCTLQRANNFNFSTSDLFESINNAWFKIESDKEK